MHARRFVVPAVAMVVLMFCGCPPKPGGNGGPGPADGAFKLGDLVAPFTPPALAELDAQAKWIDQPVLDSMELRREKDAGETPLTTVAEALALRNNSPEENDKILSGLGRLPAGPQEVDWNAGITRHTAADVKSTNPLMISSTIEFDVLGLTGTGLFGFDWNFRPFAGKDTVVSWQSSEDRMYDKVVMRDDLTWSDGKPMTAHDVAFSFQVIMSSAVPVPAVRSGTNKLKWVEAYDDHTLVFFHMEPLATNVWNINFPIIPRHVYEKSIHEDPSLQNSEYHVRLENNPVTGGAYTIVQRVRDNLIVLKARESWYMHNGKQVRDRPHFQEVRFRVVADPSVSLLTLKAGDIEEMQLTPEQWRTQSDGNDFYRNNTKAYGLEWVSFHFAWNCKTPFFSDARVRKAMSCAYDHDEMLEKLRFGLDEPCNGIFHHTSPWAPKDPPKPYKRDVNMAEKLLEEAGWIDHNGDGLRDKEIDGRLVTFEFTILTSNRQDRIDICNLLKQNLGQIGILCNVRPLEFTVLQQLTQEHKFHAAFGGWGTGTDPDTSENIWGTDEERNFGQYSNPEVDRLFDEGRREFDPEKRAEIYGKIHTLLYEDQPYTWLFTRNAYYGFNRRLRGYMFSPRGPYNYGPGFGSLWKPAAQE
jgi:peptide/nickel transport system substrate-binding protein